MSRVAEIHANITEFVTAGIWRVRLDEHPPVKAFFLKQLQILLLTLRGFNQDRCQLRAAALTLLSLLSIVPVVAMAFGIAKGFGVEKVLRDVLLEKFAGQEAVITRVIDFAHSLLENTKGGVVAGAGVIILFWTVINMLSQIERSFNEIWEVKKSRSFARKFSNYLSIMLISPIILITSGSATVLITTQVTAITERISVLGYLSPLIFLALKILPYFLMWLLLTFIYVSVPNTKVSIKSGFVAAVVAGTLYQAVQWTYITFQIGIAKYNAIYGSFAALPLFLVWLQLSWLIILIGAEFSFANQNVTTYRFEPDIRRASHSFKRLVALVITQMIVKNFIRGGPPVTAADVTARLDVPPRLSKLLCAELAESGVLIDTRKSDAAAPAYQPARDINAYTVEYVIDMLENRGTEAIPVEPTRELQELNELLRDFSVTLKSSPANRLLKDL